MSVRSRLIVQVFVPIEIFYLPDESSLDSVLDSMMVEMSVSPCSLVGAFTLELYVSN